MPTLHLAVTLSIVAALGYLAIAGMLGVSAALRAGGRRHDAHDAHDTLAASRLTMAVSIVVPANSTVGLAQTISDLFSLDYPEFEVIVVVDAPVDLASIRTAWQLESREFFYRRTLETSHVRRIFHSLRDSRLMVVEKDADQRSDALNCGVNMARYRFVAVVPPGLTFDRQALLRAMAPALRDPATVVGVGSHVERLPDDRRSATREDRFQRLRSIRSLMFTRLFWGHLRRGLGPEDGVVIWRRDAVLQASGFARNVSDTDLDMMFRLQQGVGGEDRRFVRNRDAFGETSTVNAHEALRASSRRQRAVLQMTASWGLGAAQSIGVRTFAHFLESELLTPLAQTWVVVGVLGGALMGWFSWTATGSALLLLSFGTGAVSASALLLRGAHPGAPDRPELRAMLWLAPLEVLVYRPRHAWTRLMSTFFVR